MPLRVTHWVMGITLTKVLAGLHGDDVADTALCIESNYEADVRAITLS